MVGDDFVLELLDWNAQDGHPNPRAHQEETWLRDPDGYVVVPASRSDDVAADE
jgi:hypothetical protein